jgi:hypothetical protein
MISCKSAERITPPDTRHSQRLSSSAGQRLIWNGQRENDTVVLPKQSAALRRSPAAELVRWAAD